MKPFILAVLYSLVLTMPVSAEKITLIRHDLRTGERTEKTVQINVPKPNTKTTPGTKIDPETKTLNGDKKVEEAPRTKYPYNNAGLLTTVKVGEHPPHSDKEASCSAQFVGSNDILLTAAHCVGGWVNKETDNPDEKPLEFVPMKSAIFYRGFKQQKEGGSFKVLGTFKDLNCLAYPKNYAYITDKGAPETRTRLDFAVIKTNKPARRISGLSILKDGIRNPEKGTAFGYPEKITGVNVPKGAAIMYSVTGSITETEEEKVLVMDNPFKERASGGAVIRPILNDVVGVMSSRLEGDQLKVPRLHQDLFKAMTDFVSGCK